MLVEINIAVNCTYPDPVSTPVETEGEGKRYKSKVLK